MVCKFWKSMVIHDTQCSYWDQVSLNNTNTNPTCYTLSLWGWIQWQCQWCIWSCLVSDWLPQGITWTDTTYCSLLESLGMKQVSMEVGLIWRNSSKLSHKPMGVINSVINNNFTFICEFFCTKYLHVPHWWFMLIIKNNVFVIPLYIMFDILFGGTLGADDFSSIFTVSLLHTYFLTSTFIHTSW